ncbi:MAG: DUF937 domain-containing protein [Lewinellaceae bacterium]|nr:DUF937 domain-containing protein [Lewinellaceae bacterium]
MANLLESIRENLHPELIGRAARLLNESEGGISKAIGGLAPALLAGFLEKNGDPAAREEMLGVLRRIDPALLHAAGKLLDDVATGKTHVAGGSADHRDLPDVLFGAKLPAVTHAIAAFSGVRVATVPVLLEVVGPVTAAALRQKIIAGAAADLSGLLQNEKEGIFGALPTGLASILGLTVANESGNNTLAAAPRREILWPFLLLAGLGGGILFYLKSC